MSVEQNPLHAIVMERLQVIHDELAALPNLPAANSPEALSIHEEWMSQVERCRELRRNAEEIALWVIPPDVEKFLREVRSLTYGKKSAWREPVVSEASEQVEAKS